MTIEELREEYEHKINALKEEFNNKIAELQKEESNKKWWKPEDGETYFYINGTGAIQPMFYINDYVNNKHYAFHNMFKTREEAEFARERWKVMRELEMLADDNEEWNGVNSHYTIDCTISGYGVSLCVNGFLFDRTHPFYFKSRESAQRAIDVIGEDRLRKYWFKITE